MIRPRRERSPDSLADAGAAAVARARTSTPPANSGLERAIQPATRGNAICGGNPPGPDMPDNGLTPMGEVVKLQKPAKARKPAAKQRAGRRRRRSRTALVLGGGGFTGGVY